MSIQTIIDQVNDLIECPICTDVMQDPRILPCVHTYCLKCLESLGNFNPGAKILCPVCRTEFVVPPGGVNNIPPNFFISKLCAAQLTQKSNVHTNSKCVMCDVNDESFKASLYCLDCQQHFCKRCGNAHKKIKLAEHHKMTDISIVGKELPLYNKKHELCKLHSDRSLDIYCEICKSIICLVCYTEKHKQHDMSDVKTLRQSLQEKLQQNVSAITERRENYLHHINEIKVHENVFLSDADKMVAKINEKSAELKKVIDEAAMSLLRKVEFFKNQEIKKIAMATTELETKTNILSAFMKYNEELIIRGSDPDLINGFEDLDRRAQDLIINNFDDQKFKGSFLNYKYCDSYTSAQRYVSHILGGITEAENKEDLPRKIGCPICDNVVESNHILDLNQIPDEVQKIDISKLTIKLHRNKTFTKCPVGIATLNNEIYLIFRNSPAIEVYDCDTIGHIRTIPVADLSDPCDITTVDTYLLVSQYNSGTIHCVCLTNSKCTRWQCGFESIPRLSTTLSGNLLMVSRQWNKLVEYSIDGTSLKEVALPPETRYIQKASDIGNGQYFVHHGRNNMYKITTVDSTGKKRKSFSGTSYYKFHPKSHVVGLRSDNINHYLVYDDDQRNFFLLDADLNYMREMRCVGDGCSVFRMAIDCRKRVYLLDNVVNKLVIMQLHCEE